VGSGGSTKVRLCYTSGDNCFLTPFAVDYILFLTTNVTVTPNANEIRDYKYVSKDELQAMFDDKGV
jgi:isopentenyl-diphosphate Delta-isomerase